MEMEFIPVLLAALLICSLSASIVQGQQACTHGDVRLAGGSNRREGRVEVCVGSIWGTVCYDGWGSTDSGVVCRQLGYAYEGATYFPVFASSSVEIGSGPIHMTSVRCSGAESQLVNCPYSTSYFEIFIFCDHYFDVAVRCQRGTEIDSVVEYNITDADTDIEAIQLINGEDNVNSGRLELLYNGTWGTVCDRLWSTSDAKVACRMIGYDDAACAITSNYFGRANATVPFWMDRIQCTGSEEVLDDCSFSGWGVHSCSHNNNDAGIVCANTSEIGIPSDIQLVRSTTTTLNISWTVPQLPNVSETDSVRYYILYNDAARRYYPRNSGGSNTEEQEELTYTLTSLTRDTDYTIQIRVEIQFSPCVTYISGNYSDSVIFKTNATRKQSTIPVRLISPYPELDFMGRIEVFYSNEWGTVCDDFFSTTDGNVVCQMLNFTKGALCIASRFNSFGQGTGQIWLDDVSCTSSDEVLEDCDHNGWGIHNCAHTDDVGVICRPTLPPVMNLTVVSVKTSAVTLRWSEYTFPRAVTYSGYYIRYTSGGISRATTTSRYRTTYTLRNLGFEQTYNISVRARLRYRYCFAYLYGDYSNEVSITTVETAPDGPPTSFDLEVINSTAIEALWELPEINARNGIIRGFKLFVQSMGRDIRNVTITNNQTLAYIVGGLQRSTPYTFSILAYTVADGPRSIHLTAVTLFHDPLISGFGINGDGIDKVTKQTYNYGIHVHCTVSNDPSITTTDWFFANGSKVGLVDSNFREGHYNNKTTVLQIGVGRLLTYCDGGNYTCVVNTTSGRTERRSFHLLIRSYPPSPSSPSAYEIKSTSIAIDWSQSSCDGGHVPKAFNIRYRRLTSTSTTYSYVTVIDNSERRHKITGLSPSTLYEFSVQTITFDARTSSYSTKASFSTLPPAPSAPRDVRVRLITPFVAEVSWRTPAVPNGVITHYTIYAVPQISHEETRNKRQEATLPRTIKKVFPSTSTAGNISLTEHSITYQFQVSASVNFGQTSNEGDLSPFSPNTAVFVPRPGLPKPVNLRMINFTNASITLTWEYPPPPFEAIESFLVAYIGEVDWTSPGYGQLVQFKDSGGISVTDTSVTVSPLVPGTYYLIRVSAVTQSGRGAEVTYHGITRTSTEEKLGFFQLRMSPVSSCLNFVDPSNNITDRLLKFRRAIIKELDARVCPSCGLTVANIRKDEFSCHGGLTDRIVYRAMIIGTDISSAPSLVSLIQSWVASGSASITVFSSRLRFDADCSTILDTLNDPDCPLTAEPQQTATSPKPTENVDISPSVPPHHVRPAEIGGFLIGVIIIILLAVLILVIVIIAMKKYKCKTLSFKSAMQHDRMFDASFSDIGSTKESINFDLDSKN